MIKPNDPTQLAEDLLSRSICAVKVAAVITDFSGRIFSWGWNSMGSTGMGEHAEAAAIRRSNRKRLGGAMIYVASERGGPITARPCEACEKLIRGYGMDGVCWRGQNGIWTVEYYD